MESQSASEKAEEFIKNAGQFRLGSLVTESPHPRSVNLSQTVQKDISAGLAMLADIDQDVVDMYRKWVASGVAEKIRDEAVHALVHGGKIFFTGCGATGRLSIQMVSIWRDFWKKEKAKGFRSEISAEELENRAFSVMAGGDFALIKSVEGFEDYAQFGKRQIQDLGVSKGDVVFAITEGGETSFVIGTAWQGVEAGAKVYFVYDNPDDILCNNVIRSREVIEDSRIQKINLTTGPMSITGSTRMQATSIELCVMQTLMEMILQKLLGVLCSDLKASDRSDTVPGEFLRELEEMHKILLSKEICYQTAKLVAQEEGVYRKRKKNSYFANFLGIDVLTDTTERSPTFCTPAFKKFDDTQAAESWSFLYLPYETTEEAWKNLLKRDLSPVEWSYEDVQKMVGSAEADRLYETMTTIGREEILKFRIGLDGLAYRPILEEDSVCAIVTEDEKEMLLDESGFYRKQLEDAHSKGAKTAVLYFGSEESLTEIGDFLDQWKMADVRVLVPIPKTRMLLKGTLRVGPKMLLNALSTCTMVRMGRVMGNVMIWVVPSNLKLIDRSTRYISNLTGLSYEDSCHMLFEAIEYVSPRMKAGKEYPSTVGLCVIRNRDNCNFEEAEQKLYSELGIS